MCPIKGEVAGNWRQHQFGTSLVKFGTSLDPDEEIL